MPALRIREPCRISSLIAADGCAAVWPRIYRSVHRPYLKRHGRPDAIRLHLAAAQNAFGYA